MSNVMTYGFSEISEFEAFDVYGGGDGVFGFFADIYKEWNTMWKDFGRNLYHCVNG